jgi:hypothetical protein
MPNAVSSLTAVMVVRDRCPSRALLGDLADALGELAADVDLVIVANGTTNDVSLELKALIANVADLTVVFLGVRQHDDIARLVGIDHAIGDFVLFCTPTPAEIASLPGLLAPLADEYDLVVGAPPQDAEPSEPPLTRASFRAFQALFQRLTGFCFEARPTGFRVFSRTAALYVATHALGEVLIRGMSLGPGFPAAAVPLPEPSPAKPEARRSDRMSRALRLLLTSSALPLRLSSFIGLAGGFLSLLYAVYVACVYLLKPDVQAGWTTLSLQTSGMMFIFSVLFVFLAEYLIQILSANPARSRRHLVSREITSQIARQGRRLNVIDGTGEFQLGAPADLVEGARRKRPA